MEKLKKSSLTPPHPVCLAASCGTRCYSSFDHNQKVAECQQRTEFELEDRERDVRWVWVWVCVLRVFLLNLEPARPTSRRTKLRSQHCSDLCMLPCGVRHRTQKIVLDHFGLTLQIRWLQFCLQIFQMKEVSKCTKMHDLGWFRDRHCEHQNLTHLVAEKKGVLRHLQVPLGEPLWSFADTLAC